jgi:hypothetical protein
VGLLLSLACVHAGPATAGYLVAAPTGREVVLRAAPGGRVVARLGTQTTFGTQRLFGVVERRGDWVGVTTDALPNGRLGWVDARLVGSVARLPRRDPRRRRPRGCLSAGYLHLDNASLRYLMRAVPVGTPVFVRR